MMRPRMQSKHPSSRQAPADIPGWAIMKRLTSNSIDDSQEEQQDSLDSSFCSNVSV